MVLFTAIALEYAPRDILGYVQKQPNTWVIREYFRSTPNRVIVAGGIFLDITLLTALIITSLVYQPVTDFFSHDFANFYVDHPGYAYLITAIASPIIFLTSVTLIDCIRQKYWKKDPRVAKMEVESANFSKQRNSQGYLCFGAANRPQYVDAPKEFRALLPGEQS